ncbi:nuclear transport factor 2 family protein [Nocardioides sp. BP30]|uniref:nuclear transport factor 2 family protein n=1 Tax=Nocardioides sp. BP30 TaxID=3036374 RepID=UPI002468F493|nr:nuclear transport factor 2 family protein [Nocardioides sp. BP30]WGL53437.1 nuclear transport factor 2 family protein [Nocardioides sp. BP30]
MTDQDPRADLVRRALAMTAGADPAELESVFTEDVTFTTPALFVAGRAELAAELALRDTIMSDLGVDIGTIGIDGDSGWAEWVVTAQFASDLSVDDGDERTTVVQAVGRPVRLEGATAVAFDGDRISALRQYWDEVALLDALGLLPGD